MSDRDSRLLFLDLETTGFDARVHHILELGAILVDAELDEIDRWHFAVPRHELIDGAPVGSHRADVAHDPVVASMHEQSGLLSELDALVAAGRALTVAEVEQRLMHALAVEHGINRRALELAGFSVHFDRTFLDAHMPAFAAYLSHRIVDVSTLRSLYRRWRGVPTEGPKAHRALADCEHAIADLRWYRNALFGGHR